MAYRMILNETSYFGAGSRKVIAEEVAKRGYKKALIVTDKDLIKFGVADQVIAVLKDANIPYEIFDEVKPNPTVKNVKAGIAAFQAAGADFMIAIGGGSSMDTSKAIGIIINNPEFSDVVSLEGVANTKKKSVPVIALPTTAGTAAEVTINYVITDEENVKKMVCVDPNDIPTLAIIDPELMLSMPRGLTASTGMDALTHAIEGLITLGAWEMSDMFETKAIEMIAKWLPKAVENPSDIEARDGSYTYFNHNSKYLTRAETDELLLEPLLNGNEIMEYTSLPPGPAVGTIREALLKAQVAGEVTDRDSAIAFVKNYAAKLK